jgi:hypothetical protein
MYEYVFYVVHNLKLLCIYTYGVNMHVCMYVFMYVCTTDKGDDGQTLSAVKVGAPIQQYGHKWTN